MRERIKRKFHESSAGKYAGWLLKFSILCLLATLGLDMFCNRQIAKIRISVAKEVISLLYDYGSEGQLEAQNAQLKKYVTNDVFNQLTVDNEERRLNTYLKFTDNACTVKFVKITDDYVIYRLECASIADYRNFVFMYEVNTSGKICKLRECELIDFMVEEETE